MTESVQVDLFVEELNEQLRNGTIESFRKKYLSLHSFEQAQVMEQLDDEERLVLYSFLSPEEMAMVFENIDEDRQQTYLAEMHPVYASTMLGDMYVDDAVDVLSELEPAEVAGYLNLMPEKASEDIKELLHYEEKTAGSLMTTEYVAVRVGQTVLEAMAVLKQKAPDAETIYYVYVLNDMQKLLGVLSLRSLIVSADDTLVDDILNARVLSVGVGDDQEDVAKRFKDYDLLAVPVVDVQHRLLGIITVDDIVDVIEEEASDDYAKLAAAGDARTAERSSWESAKKRLPWLVILLFLGMLTATLIGQFETTLDKVAVLAIFIPMIAGMAGNTGTQALAVAVRKLATGEAGEESTGKLIVREAGTGIITGSVCGVLIFAIVSIWQGNMALGLLVGSSIFITLIAATLAGALVPLLMHRLKIDPAVASGPFITTINDLLSILIYFGAAQLFLSYLLK
ncbi:magnesium transporter [Aureibacillus halotolerans]|uniref:Magnesium transporter MgtE n=1 Tax=Aureibacillus halotolerans TaxID=1508390 RepID=A0A4R6U8L6_9BACI|nr:magnesium transporter [Aureibacillus halotolerans]TDQ42146.1 magnesium transporter [Aureibacillus halotolerans]